MAKKAKKVKMRVNAAELEHFMNRYNLGPHQLAEAVGVTKPAVDHWLTGRRAVPMPVVKMLRFFEAQPKAISYFIAMGQAS